MTDRFELHGGLEATRPLANPAISSPEQETNQLRWAVRAARVGTWVNYIQEGRVVWSPELHEILGVNPGEFAGTEQAFFEVVYPIDRSTIAPIIEEAKEAGEEYEIEFRFVRDGELRWMFARGKANLDDQGRPLSVAGCAMDVTDRKRARISLEVIHDLSESLGDATSLAEIFEVSIDALQKALGVDRASILLFDEDNVMRFQAWRNLSEGYREKVEGHSPWTADAVDPQPIVVSEVTEETVGPLWQTIYDEGIRSLGFYPLQIGGKLIGKFMVYYDRAHQFHPDEVDLAQVISRGISAAIEKHHADEEIVELNYELNIDLANMTRLQHLSTRLVQTEGMQTLLDEIVDAAIEVTRADKGMIQLFRDGALRIVAQRGLPEPFIEYFNQLGTGEAASGAAVATGKRVLVEDVATNPLLVNTKAQQVKLDAGILAVQATPLITRSGKTIGTISTHYSRNALPSSRDLSLLDLLARQAVDLIERTASEQALRESEAQFRVMADSAPVMIWLCGKDKDCTWFNRPWLDFVGRDLEQELGSGWAENLHPEDREAYYRAYEEAFRERRPYSAEFRIRRKDGTWRWILEHGTPLNSLEGFAGFIGSGIDITEKKEMEEVLRTARSELEVVTASMSAPVTRCSRDLKYLWVNEAYCRWRTCRKEDIIGASIEDVLGEKAFRLLRPYFDLVLSGEDVSYEQVIDVKGIGSRWVEATYSPTFAEDGSIDGWVAVIIDITDRKRAEQTVETLLRISERLSQTLDIDDLLDALIQEVTLLVGVEGGVAGLATSEGMACERYFRRGEVLPLTYVWAPGAGLPGWLLQHKTPYLTNDAATDPQIVQELCSQFGVRTALSTPILDARGDVLGFFEIHNKLDGTGFTDSDRDLLLAVSHIAATAIQNALAYRQIQDADRRKDEFLATLAHELRNPLAPIRNSVQLMEVVGRGMPQLREPISIIERQVLQMSRLVDDLLDISRINLGRIRMRKSMVEIAEIVRNAVETVRPMVADADHELTVNLPVVPIWLEADPVRLSQVISNLLNNAVKYTDRFGKIELTVTPGDGFVNIIVKDNGIGIMPEQLPRIFEIFSQVGTALTRAEGGLGIGLSLVKGIVELHGGTVSAYSDGYGNGSEFVVKLPTAGHKDFVPVPQTPQQAVVQAPANLKIVVADDNVDHATTLQLLLELDGHEIRAAHDGESAFEIIARFRPDIALLDIGMPRLNGYELARKIRGEDWGNSIALVALTGWGQDQDRRSALEAGFDHHITKPVEPRDLRQLLASLSQKRLTPEPVVEPG